MNVSFPSEEEKKKTENYICLMTNKGLFGPKPPLSRQTTKGYKFYEMPYSSLKKNN